MGFKTKIDFSDNRQIKQFPETLTVLSGATSFGLPFNQLIVGPDSSTSGVSESYSNVLSSFSGNSGTTNYTWYDSRMQLGAPYLSALTPSNSANTQNTGLVFTSNTTTIIDGNLITTSYSGVSFDVNNISMIDLGGGNYMGSFYSTNFSVLSAGTLDFTGRTIWVDVSGYTRTNDLIITNSPSVGNVWTCINSEGKGAWMASSGSSSGNTYWSASTGTYGIVQNNSNGLSSGILAVSQGNATVATGNYSHAEGLQTTASGTTTHAEGFNTTAGGEYSHAEGNGTKTSADYAHSQGLQTLAAAVASHSEGGFTTAGGTFSHAEGNSTKSIGTASHSEGNGTTASGLNSHSEGGSTTATGDQSHSEGSLTTAIGSNSHVEGQSSVASGTTSHAEGSSTTASDFASHSEGLATTAIGVASHAEGVTSKSYGDYSHAQNEVTKAFGRGSHSEGSGTTAMGNYSHAQGFGTFSSGNTSFSSGYMTRANGDYSFVHGYNNYVNGNRSVVIGGSNITGNTDDFVYVPSLNIKLVGAGPGVTDIGIDANGNVVDQASDIRIKENIIEIEDALSKILKLRGVKYNWRDRENGGNEPKLGFIAQEVKEIIPELTYYNKNSDLFGVHYKDFSALLVEAIKELNYKITDNGRITTQTILAEDNNIELNYSGNSETAIGGGIKILNAINNESANFITDINGDWTTNNSLKPKSLIIPFYTPSSSKDNYGKFGDSIFDDEYFYIKTNNGWKRTKLEEF